LAADGLEDVLGVVLQLGLALLETLVGVSA
jgi:hypothetical protein